MMTTVSSEVSGAQELGPPPAFGGESSRPTSPASLLGAVTQHVQSGSAPSPRAGASPTFAPPGSTSPPVAPAATPPPAATPELTPRPIEPQATPQPVPAAAVRPAVETPRRPDPPTSALTESSRSRPPVPDPDESITELVVAGEERSAGKGWLWAFAGLAAGVVVVFAVPQVREKVMGLAGNVVGEPEAASEAIPAEVDAASRALVKLDPTELGRAEATLQSRLDEGGVGPGGVAAMKLAQVELLAARAIEFQIQAAVDPAGAEGARTQAADYSGRASRIFDGISTEAAPDRAQLKRVRGLLRLSEGRSADEVLPLLPEAGAEELRVWVAAAPLWRDAEAAVPANVISELRGLGSPGMLSRALLALAYMRGGDTAGAQNEVERGLSEVAGQPSLSALKAALSGAGDTVAEDTDGAEEDGEGDTKEDAKADTKDDAKADATDDPRVGSGGGGGGGGGGMSTDALIDKGCAKVDGGDAAGGISLLLKAFDRRPGDLDVLVCLGKGNAKQGNRTMAASYFDRALAKSPRHRGALEGAARLAEKAGQTERALALYKKLLAVDPGNGPAKAFIGKHEKPAEAEAPAPAPAKAPTDAPATPPAG